MKKLFASLLAIMMLASMLVLPTSAASGIYKITINGTSTDHTYEAYQIFAGTISEQNGKKILSTITWGDGVDDEADGFLEAIKAISYTESGSATIKTPFASVVTAQDVADELGKFNNNGTVVDQFAAAMGKFLTTTKASSTEGADNVYTISGLASGYYLVKDEDGTVPGDTDNETYTKYLIAVVGDAAVTVKGSYPTLTKKVADVKDGTYGDATDVSVTGPIYYELIGTLPSNFSEYDSYYYKFTDVAADAITINAESVAVYQKVHNVSGMVELTGYIKNYDPATNTLSVEFPNLRTAQANGATANWALTDTIVVRYTATLNTSDLAMGGTGNRNEAYLTYSNDPNEVNTAATGTTTPDEVAVYTYQLKVKKVSTDDVALDGAEFHVLRKTVVPSGEFMTVDADGYFSGWTTSESEAALFRSGDDGDGCFIVKGLDEGSYWLREHKAPDGYNMLTSDVNVIIVSNFETADATRLHSLTVQVGSGATTNGTLDTGMVEVAVENKSGTTLPSTGGMGTTLFYVVGAALMLGAVVVIVAKKRETK